jgi:acetylglutamate kinase
MQGHIEKARVLMEALPYIKKFWGSTVVVKYGGHAMDDPELKKQVILDFILMKLVGIKLVILHGGGPHISSLMKRLGKEALFIEGHRVTDSETMEITEMVLSGLINKEIVALINSNGGKAVGISGKDGKLIVADKKQDKSGKGLDFGQVGVIRKINPEILLTLTQESFIPVISPVAIGEDGATYNVNADTGAGFIASTIKARRLIYMTDIRGIYEDINDEATFKETLDEKQISDLKSRGAIEGGMIPKIDSALYALKEGVEKVHIIDGRVEHSLLLELFTEGGIGTQIVL